MRRAYQSALTDAEWSCLEPHLPLPNATGRPELHSTREMRWAREWAKEGVELDTKKFMPEKGPRPFCRRDG